jgi:3'(2'), 5'-bisphosphate nucleotidase
LIVIMIDRLANAVRAVGAQLLEWRQSGHLDGRWVDGQFKAEADRRAHEALEEQLKRLSSSLPIVSEEDPDSLAGERPDTYWLVDPIDGTASFAHGFDGFVTQAALMRNRRPSLSAVYAPATDEMFLAEEGAGATHNGEPLRVRTRPLSQSTLTDNYPKPHGVAADLMRAFNIPHYLESGSLGLKICRVAEGRADMFVKSVVVRDWDVGPAHLVLTEAGGVMVDAAGDPFPYYGRFDHRGLVAAASKDAIRRIVSWLAREEPNPSSQVEDA